MIQAPQTQYIPNQQMIMPQNQQPAAGNNVQYQQPYEQPSVYYNYPMTSCYPQSQKSQFNGVNIELINPQGLGVNTPQPYYQPVQPQYYQPVQPQVQQQPVQPQYYQPAQPQVQQQPVQPQYYQPVQPSIQQPVQPPVNQDVQVTAAPADNTQEAPQTQSVPEPQIQTQEQVKPEVQAPKETLDPEIATSFAGKLNETSGLDQQAVIEDIATKIKTNDPVANSLLDERVFDALADIINTDTSALPGPSPEVIELRQKENLTEDEKQKASELSPLEIAENNKQYALFTISYMQNRLNSELEKNQREALELKDLPCIETVVNAVKTNPDPAVRAAGIATLANIAKPQYKADLNTIFQLAEQDENPQVQSAASKAIERIS